MRAYKILQYIRDRADALLTPGPYFCLLCGTETYIGEDGLCDACRESLRLCPNPAFPEYVDGATVGLQYTDAVADAVLRFKNHREFVYAAFFAQYMSIPDDWHPNVIIPVPMHPSDEFQRGYNQSALLARQISALYGIPYSEELLSKTKRTQAQKGLNKQDRIKNIRGCFEAHPLCKDLRIVLVDDVCTTGATLRECARVLKKTGAARVYLCCAASPIF